MCFSRYCELGLSYIFPEIFANTKDEKRWNLNKIFVNYRSVPQGYLAEWPLPQLQSHSHPRRGSCPSLEICQDSRLSTSVHQNIRGPLGMSKELSSWVRLWQHVLFNGKAAEIPKIAFLTSHTGSNIQQLPKILFWFTARLYNAPHVFRYRSRKTRVGRGLLDLASHFRNRKTQ